MVSLIIALMLIGPHPKFVVLDSAVRARLARDWDSKNPHQVERGYCVAYTEGYRWGVPVYRVWAIAHARTLAASTNSILAECPTEPGIAFLHVHPPATCEASWNCKLNGDDAYQCFPSEQDQANLDQSDEPFGLVQCDKNAVIYYFKQTPDSVTTGRLRIDAP